MNIYKKITILFSLLFCHVSGGNVFAENILLNTKQGDWESQIVINDGQAVFRAFTQYVEGGNRRVLAFDRLAGNCERQNISVNIILSSPAENTYKSKSVPGAARVDEMPVHNSNYKINADAGKNMMLAKLATIENQGALLEEITGGKMLRFKLIPDGNEFFLHFSLDGFNAASARSALLCNKYNNERANQNNATDREIKAKDDKAYF